MGYIPELIIIIKCDYCYLVNNNNKAKRRQEDGRSVRGREREIATCVL